LDRGTATSTAGAATINHQAGVVTTEALTTAAASAYAFTLTDSRITTTSIVQLQLMVERIRLVVLNAERFQVREAQHYRFTTTT